MRLQCIDLVHMEFLDFGEDLLALLVLGRSSGVRALPMIQLATGRTVHEQVSPSPGFIGPAVVHKVHIGFRDHHQSFAHEVPGLRQGLLERLVLGGPQVQGAADDAGGYMEEGPAFEHKVCIGFRNLHRLLHMESCSWIFGPR